MLFYRPGNSRARPPPADAPEWDLGDNDQWKSEHKFPAYAIPGAFGTSLMEQLSLYSGNLSDAPQGPYLTMQYENATARAYGLIALENEGSSFPGLWVFLLIILAALVLIVASSSIIMKLVQRGRRVSLRERIIAGEVDLEVLGIKRLRVPQHVLDKMPLYTYDKDGQPAAPTPTHAQVESKPTSSPTAPSTSADSEDIPSSSPQTYERLKSIFSQTTCPICLDDFLPGQSVIRELPCQHFFHPECIDAFLLQNSSLCPVCKKTVFPSGYCPDLVTDAMVRQERYARRSGQRRPMRGATMIIGDSPMAPRQSRFDRLAGRLGFSRSPVGTTQQSYAMAQTPSPPPPSPPPPPTNGATDLPGRREEMRRRAVAMLGNRRMAEDEERERDAARPACKKDLDSRSNIPIL
ncbi:predicted protein [Uncinocarpus reesii 1704]|uniref:RING-type domain-containing protein n=1 Tax=Uncinocarpus reesii (strain UAMH 1704) TaxID=336963 RepID=C4JVL6_UNCRE|nr:uncharacterized protein UREG_06608 [Uncinocarpus reesii 1704]EEP81743.1 predicted protein [Uncinocarpus reesii 1704]